ncbi:MAG: biopolymer transporter ExbD [Bdellovibrionales bacterium]|nr:biopolymer transporter ExbD [Bdellovibrionales bacterium]
MAGGGVGFGKGGKGRVDNLNLVPFVDLFSTLIIFLISTAVWDDLAAVKVNLGAQDKPSVEVQPNPDIKKIKSDVKITVSDSGIEIFDQGKSTRYAKTGDQMDFTPIEQFLAATRAKYVDKRDMLIFATDAAVYEDVVAVMDRSIAQNFTDLIVTGQEQK